ncbi:ABC transporter substrate binding protein [Halarcobacter ebronensis]|uniref:histidine kinase n=1 Tax=Halarcobacter ebronensis TaxID=1462615 RepID=A0A4Q1AUU0_9BACT|nr:ABC transporter substrate binding protein [Halarcobacter ebronensis]QKF80668.1 PAS sensor-containing two-component system histidine kinase [Halarcobacter ebronensis]RXK08465.1 histidine kinase [Halarcobacter ebronensis]
MKKITVLFLLFLSFTYLYGKEVLFLNSYHKGYKWSDDIIQEVEKKLKPLKDVELTVFYMDTKRIMTPSYIEKLASLYEEQLKNRKFDLVIASDNSAFEFVLEQKNRLFKNTPILFCGINNFDKTLIEKSIFKDEISGIEEQVDLEKNFELILDLQPELKNLLIINDKSKTGLAMKKDLESIIKKYSKRLNIEYIDNMDIDHLKNKISNLKKDTAILLVLLFKDGTGKYFTYKNGVQQIRAVSHVPIYGLWDFYLDYGVLGGLVTSAIAQGEAVGDMAIRVLNGTPIKEIPIVEKSPNKYLFDYNEIKRFDLDVDGIGRDYEIINEPYSFIKAHTKIAVIALTIIAILLIMIFSMRANIRRRIVVEKALQNRIKFDKVLVDTLPNPIYYKNKDGKFLGCNRAFSELLNISKSEVIGKTAKDFFSLEIALKNQQIDQELLKTLGTNSSEMTLHTPDNHMKHIIINKAVYLNNDGSIGGIVCVMDDITERMQQKQFLIQQSKLAEMGDMVAAIAHQWNEPLVELSAQVQDIQTSFLLNELKGAQVKEFVNDSMVQLKYMSKTLSDFRNFLKPSTKKTLFSIRKAFEEIFEILGKQIYYSNINLKFNYDYKSDELLIYGYENEFKQVLLNLINNAKNKIIEKNSIEKYNLIINILYCENFTTIEIIDDGGNIDENIVDKIFEPYFTTKKDGTGFGLYMAKVIIEDKMGGIITAQNRDKYVVFTIKMPHRKE